MQRKKVAIIGTTGLPAKYGGFETLAHHLTLNLQDQFDFSVYCSNKYFASSRKRKSTFNGSRLIYLPLNANGYQSIIYDIVSIFHALFYADVLLVLGVSGSIILPFLKMFSSKPIIINIDGQEWKRPKWNKYIQKFLKFSERLAVKYADVIIADNKVIQDYVKSEYNSESALITYGGDHVSKKSMSPDIEAKFPFAAMCNYAFTVCRIEPENNVQLILEAYAEMPDKKLVIVGLWNHGNFGIQLRKQYSNYPNIFLLDPIYDQDELNILRSNAELYIHGHGAGGTNPSLVEAMCLGLPIVAYGISYNRETTMHMASYFMNATELRSIIQSIERIQLNGMGVQMGELGKSRYSWKNITSEYSSQINWLTNVSTNTLMEGLKQQKAETIKIYTTKTKATEAV